MYFLIQIILLDILARIHADKLQKKIIKSTEEGGNIMKIMKISEMSPDVGVWLYYYLTV